MSGVILPSRVFENPICKHPYFNGYQLNQLDQQHFLSRNLIYSINSFDGITKFRRKNYEPASADRITPLGRALGNTAAGYRSLDGYALPPPGGDFRFTVLDEYNSDLRDNNWSMFMTVYAQRPKIVQWYDSDKIFQSSLIRLYWSSDGSLLWLWFQRVPVNQLILIYGFTSDTDVEKDTNAPLRPLGYASDHDPFCYYTLGLTIEDNGNGVDYKYYVNGTVFREGDIDIVPEFGNTDEPTTLGAGYNTSGRAYSWNHQASEVSILCYYEWNRVLAPSEMHLLHRDPYVLMRK